MKKKPAELQYRFDIAQAVERRFGVNVDHSLEQRLFDRVHELLEDSKLTEDELLDRLKYGADQDTTVEAVQQAVSIGETYFFRAIPQLKKLENAIVETILEPKRRRGLLRLRAWSAGCSTGEEAYTLAALFKRIAPDFEVQIVGTDMNERSLSIARTAIYGRRSFRALSSGEMDEWVRPHPRGFAVVDALKENVSFLRYNLVTDQKQAPQLKEFDIVLCRNVLIYLKQVDLPGVMKSICERSKTNSLLVLTPAEYPAARYVSPHRDLSNGILHRNPEHKQTRVVRGRPQGVRSGQSAIRRDPTPKRVPPSAATVQSNPSPGARPLAKARAAADQGRFDEANQHIDAALAVQPDSAHAYCLRAEIASAQGQYVAATGEYWRAIFLDYNSAEAHCGLALTLMSAGRNEEALVHLRRALGLLDTMSDGDQLEGFEQPVSVVRALVEHSIMKLARVE